ncbi:MAG: O-methyltransferase [Chitinophagaceae bacterium]|nr:O-methyltransferase [Chitinophagaceae bacterium]MBP9103945.1 O-methyltransferase [Chitinophagaceae bacterium]
MELIHPSVQAYAETFSSVEDILLKEVNDFTIQQHAESNMLSGHLQGKVLEMISCMIRPRRVLEIGTFTGYSALCLAKGLANDGELHTIELREKDAVQARSFFDRSLYADQIISHTGNALTIIPQLNEIWDLVFIDADKPAYIEYFNLVLPRLRKNGFILADNIFFHGQVLEENIKARPNGSSGRRKSAIGIKAFNEFIKDRTDIEKVVLTIRDGLYLIRKLN